MDATATLNYSLIGQYDSEREIGAGGMARVYLSRDVRHHRRVALEVLRSRRHAALRFPIVDGSFSAQFLPPNHTVADDSPRVQLQKSLGAAYTIECELGGGGMSRVFLVHDTELARRIVIKVLSPDLAEGLSADRFAREIKLAALLQEPHIVPVLSAGQTAEGLPWYSMPFVEGESLRAHLAGGALPLAEAVALLRNVAQALSYAHAHGVVHRDIKPENILISSGTAVVADFGIAKAVSAAKTQAPGGTITQIGMSLGTPAYMAPEQALGDSGTDHRADIYAWGTVAYEAITGEHVFPGRTSAQQIIAAHLAEAPRPIAAVAPTVPPPLEALVMRCLEKDPARRPASASELVDALSDATMYSSAAALAPPPAPPVQKRLVYAIGVASADRAVAVTLPGLSGALRVASAEDILLAKLRWYRLGDESSEVQRRDIEGLIALTGDRLDFTHLRAWAPALAVGDLLSRFLLARRPEP